MYGTRLPKRAGSKRGGICEEGGEHLPGPAWKASPAVSRPPFDRREVIDGGPQISAARASTQLIYLWMVHLNLFFHKQ